MYIVGFLNKDYLLACGMPGKRKQKTKTAFYLACKNPAKMDTYKKEQ